MIYEDNKNADETLKPIRNIFKMSRVLVDSSNRKSQKKQKLMQKNSKSSEKLNATKSNNDSNQDTGSNEN